MQTTTTTRKITIKGQVLPAGTTVRAKLSSGNRSLVLVSYNGQSRFFQVSPVAGI